MPQRRLVRRPQYHLQSFSLAIATPEKVSGFSNGQAEIVKHTKLPTCNVALFPGLTGCFRDVSGRRITRQLTRKTREIE
jgi:hypothetical protein